MASSVSIMGLRLCCQHGGQDMHLWSMAFKWHPLCTCHCYHKKQRQKVEDIMDDFYSINKYKKAFAYAINPINGCNLWVQ